MKIGKPEPMSGCITKAMYLRMQPSHELERRLGYRAGRLADGWWLLFLLDMPTPGQFEFRGYTQMSGGVAQGHLPNPPDPRTSEQRLRDDGVDLVRLKEQTIRDTFRLSGADRLAKVVPVRGAFGADDYPAGTGIPQWALTAKLNFKPAAKIAPGGIYQGFYA